MVGYGPCARQQAPRSITMMEQIVAFGKSGLTLHLPDGPRYEVLRAHSADAIPNPRAALDAALDAPIGSPSLSALAAGKKTAAISVCDITRPAPNRLTLPPILERLHAARNLKKRPFEIKTLPMPAPVVFEGQRLPASYANFYIANDLVLVPTFNDPNDRIALNTLAECFPTRTITGIHCTDFIWGLGALHCMTQQEPA